MPGRNFSSRVVSPLFVLLSTAPSGAPWVPSGGLDEHAQAGGDLFADQLRLVVAVQVPHAQDDRRERRHPVVLAWPPLAVEVDDVLRRDALAPEAAAREPA